MATISIAGNTLSGCLGAGSFAGIGTAFSNVKKNTNSLTQSISSLKSKVSVAAQAADVSASANSTSRVLTRENQKQSAVSLVYDKLDKLISNAGKVDNLASGAVEKLKQEFYRKYSYLKPECEKGLREKAADLFKGAWDGLCSIHNAIANFVCDAVEWVKANWEAVVAIVVAVVAIIAVVVVSVLTFGAAAVLIAAAIGCALGLAKQLVTDLVVSALTGELKFSSWTDYLSSGLGGAVGGILALTGATALGSGFASGLSTMLKGGLKNITGEEKSSLTKIFVDSLWDGAISALFAGAFKKFSLKSKIGSGLKAQLAKIPILRRFDGTGSYQAAFKGTMTKLAHGTIKHVSITTWKNGLMHIFTDDIFSGIWGGGKKVIKTKLKELFNFDFDLKPSKIFNIT